MTSARKDPHDSSQDVDSSDVEDSRDVEDTWGVEQARTASTNDSFFMGRSRARQSSVLAMATLTAAAVAASMVVLSVLPSSPTEERLPTPFVTAHPSELLLGCLDASIDPFNPIGSDTADERARSAPAALWTSANGTAVEFLHGGKITTEPPSQVNGASWGLKAELSQLIDDEENAATAASNELPHAASLVGQKGGELRGLSILPCTPPSLEHWFAVGATSIGEDLLIRLANTGSQPSVVTLSAWGASGPLDQLSETHIVAAGETLSIQPGRYFLNEERLILRLNADGPGVSAWLFTSAMSGEVPQGAAWIASTLPSSRQVIPGLTAGAAHTLRLAVPPIAMTDPSQESSATPQQSGSPAPETPRSRADRPTGSGSASDRVDGEQSDPDQSGGPRSAPDTGDVTVTLRVLNAEGTHDIPGGTLTMAENSVLDVNLPEVSEASALIIDASSPVVAQVLTRFPGTQWPAGTGQAQLNEAGAGQQHWQGRGVLSASSGIERIQIPSASDMNSAIIQSLDVPIVRPTSVTTPVQASPSGHDLLLVNPTDKDHTISYGDEERSIPAQTSLVIPLKDTAAPLMAGEAIHAVIIAHAELPTGSIDAVWPLGSVTLTGLTRAVDLR